PFMKSTLLKTLLATQSELHSSIRTLRPEVSIATASLIDRCLAKTPNERHADAKTLLDALISCHSRNVPVPTITTKPTEQLPLEPDDNNAGPSAPMTNASPKASALLPGTTEREGGVSEPFEPIASHLHLKPADSISEITARVAPPVPVLASKK